MFDRSALWFLKGGMEFSRWTVAPANGSLEIGGSPVAGVFGGSNQGQRIYLSDFVVFTDLLRQDTLAAWMAALDAPSTR
jgi:hypothetical protein